eukprot:CAMPEP_0197673540 /NCGR_PEP_ID=MMETSP1338-20131121/81151_1 /TAXON_ID=43686 ORGANISM="Pelagodinium beii, Strain RCC1491" /NCGR_SAMPLE_ID=MMETSP1338 /ASSEMBLY_ACC=CAM_ASM_000754 /LENGTH=81 /DNA_ID=CAMNT_0043253807 /DNA_START=87 /DNA_END=332 /DNA_ORIENTATION=-
MSKSSWAMTVRLKSAMRAMQSSAERQRAMVWGAKSMSLGESRSCTTSAPFKSCAMICLLLCSMFAKKSTTASPEDLSICSL